MPSGSKLGRGSRVSGFWVWSSGFGVGGLGCRVEIQGSLLQRC